MKTKRDWWKNFLWPLKPLAGDDDVDFNKAEYARIPVIDKLSNADILSYFGQLRDYAKHEDGLINIRLTWSLTIHAFLLTTYGLLLNKAVEILLGLSKLDNATGPEAIVRILLCAQIVIAFTGVAIGLTSLAAIRAAHKAILTIAAIARECLPPTPVTPRNPFEDSKVPRVPKELLYPRLAGGGALHNVKDAQLYYVAIPKLLSIFWSGLFLASMFLAGWSFFLSSFFKYFTKP